MKKYNLTNGNTITIPEHISEITVEQLVNFNALGEIGNTINDMERLVRVFSNTGFTINDVSLEDFLDIVETLGKLLATKPVQRATEVFVLDGETYHCVEVEDLTTKEFIDFDTLSENPVEKLPLLLAIAYRPEHDTELTDKNYIDVLTSRAELFKKLDAQTAQEAICFFSQKFIEYAQHTAESLMAEMKVNGKMEMLMEELKKTKELIDGVGSC